MNVSTIALNLPARSAGSLVVDRADAIDQVRVRVLPDGRMDPENSARYLDCAQKTLAQRRMQRKGPRWVKVQGRVFYYLDDLDASIRGGIGVRTPNRDRNGEAS
jgi:hypothetical protein